MRPETRTGFSLLGLTLWLLVLQPSVGANHHCEIQKSEQHREEHPCSDLLELITNDDLDFLSFKEGTGTSIMSPDAVCIFSRTEHVLVTECCNGWEGENCDIQLDNGSMYCYVAESCQGPLVTNTSAMSIASCCDSSGGGSWGSQSSNYGCTPCSPTNVIKVAKDRDMATCMTSGDDVYRTFDGVLFNYHSTCAVGLVVTDALKIYTVTECDPTDKCTCLKVVTIQMSVHPPAEYVLENTLLTVSEGSRTYTLDLSKNPGREPIAINGKGSVNARYDDMQESVYISLASYDMEIRTDADGTLMLTVKESSILRGSLAGVCGDMDGYTDDEISLQSKARAERVFDQYTSEEIPCGSGMSKCATQDEEDAATEACMALNTVFYRCHSEIDVNDYMERCRAYYCTGLTAAGMDAAKEAVCNVMSTYNKICTAITGEAVNWRSASLCRKIMYLALSAFFNFDLF
ncbi:sco-spondin [Plakobranchus ocellatus]|uniref:Sco-spondin n=1 Tax=Plakobranchus ocellatus TaxID=259542 RepID=A0AAV4C8K7_9GAST|nr:sco-spondin [Plakobranchus ocellatus]